MYGHVFEVFCVAATYRGDCAASACKAKEVKYAEILVWDLTKTQVSVPTCRLAAHKLTVVQLEFSKCDQYLVSCGRDRVWALFKRAAPDSFEFAAIAKQKDAHLRIIWGITWSHDDTLIATASRDKKQSVKFWTGITAEEPGQLHSIIPEN